MGDQVTVDRDEWEATKARLRDLEGDRERLRALEEVVARLAPPGVAAGPVDPTGPADVLPAGGPTTRRKALFGLAAAGAGAAALMVGQASPAAANGQGGSFTLGDPTNSATNTTGLAASLNDRPALRAANGGSHSGIVGVKGVATGIAATAGVVGESQGGAGVLGLSTNSTAVSAFSQNAVGIDAASGAYADDFGPVGGGTLPAVRATSQDRPGIVAVSKMSPAVMAYSQRARGLFVTSVGTAPDFGQISSSASAVFAQGSTVPGVIAVSGIDRGVWARSDTNVGVDGSSRTSIGVLGSSTNSTGVVGTGATGVAGGGSAAAGSVGVEGSSPATSGIGVRGAASAGGGTGVLGTADSVTGTGVRGVVDAFSGAGVRGTNPAGIGVLCDGRIPLRLIPAVAITTVPASASSGDLWVGADANLWTCVRGAPFNQWRILASPRTAGALHVLPAPARVYDSRPGTAPAVAPKTKLVPNQARTIDLKANSSGVPAGATAALLTILLVNAATGNGNITVWANGVTRPQANTLVWGGATGRFTATATSAVDAQAQVQVLASLATDVVVDVVGYYR